ncbi:MAG: SPOR domain-containing protein [Mariprofundaceae bacterium]
MAEQDFAHVQSRKTVVPEVKLWTTSKTLLLSVSSVALVLGSFLAGFWLGRDQGIEVASGEDKAQLEQLLKKKQAELAVLRAEAKKQIQPKVSTTQVGELTFYNELPKQNVKPAPLLGIDTYELKAKAKSTHHKPKVVTQVKSSGQHYILQIASFPSKKDAESFVVKLRRQDFSGVIHQVKLPQLGLWYRVYIEGLKSRKAANKIRAKVKKNMNITAVVIKRG